MPGPDPLPYEHMSTRELIRVMLVIQQMRREQVKTVRERAEASAEAKKDATVARARAFLAAEGRPQTERDQVGRLKSADAVFAADVAKADLDAARETLSVLKDDWDTARTVNANQRAEKNAIEGYGS